jgi:primosomal protein N' (replication factor Y)
MSRTTYFVDVILPLAIPNLYTYRVPYEMNGDIAIGKRVIVQFGRGKLYSALVRRIHEIPPKKYEAKYIDSILDEHPIANIKQFELWDWMSQYYLCSIGEVMTAALPGGLRLASETKIVLNPVYTNDKEQSKTLSDKEHAIVEALEIRTVLSINDVSQILEQKTVYPVIKSLIEKGVVLIQEELKEKFKPKIESFVRITEYADDEENLKNIFPALEKKAPKQLDVLMAYISLSGRYSKSTEGNKKEVKKSDILKKVPGAEAALKGMVQKNIFEIYEREVGRFASFDNENKISQLNEVQQNVLDSIEVWMEGSTKYKV